jgi:hypothetical protein
LLAQIDHARRNIWRQIKRYASIALHPPPFSLTLVICHGVRFARPKASDAI